MNTVTIRSSNEIIDRAMASMVAEGTVVRVGPGQYRRADELLPLPADSAYRQPTELAAPRPKQDAGHVPAPAPLSDAELPLQSATDLGPATTRRELRRRAESHEASLRSRSDRPTDASAPAPATD